MFYLSESNVCGDVISYADSLNFDWPHPHLVRPHLFQTSTVQASLTSSKDLKLTYNKAHKCDGNKHVMIDICTLIDL